MIIGGTIGCICMFIINMTENTILNLFGIPCILWVLVTYMFKSGVRETGRIYYSIYSIGRVRILRKYSGGICYGKYN